MPHEVSYDDNEGIVRVCVAGKATHKDHVAARDEAVRIGMDKKCSILLVDLRDLNTTHSSTVDCFDFGKSLSETRPCFRIALVLPADSLSRKDVRFTAVVAENRGGSVRVFDKVEDAKTWLLDQGQVKTR